MQVCQCQAVVVFYIYLFIIIIIDLLGLAARNWINKDYLLIFLYFSVLIVFFLLFAVLWWRSEEHTSELQSR